MLKDSLISGKSDIEMKMHMKDIQTQKIKEIGNKVKLDLNEVFSK